MKYIKDYLLTILSILGSIASIATIYILDPQEQGKVALIILGSLLALCLIHDWKYAHKVNSFRDYVGMFSEMNNIYAQVRSDDDKTVEDVTNRLTSFCEALSNVFTKLHEHRIGVCIKLIIEDKGEARVFTLTRDSNSKAHGRMSGSAEKTKHTLAGNSDFAFIYERIEKNIGGEAYYYNPDISTDISYVNTNLPIGKQPKSNNIWNRRYRSNHWPLKYKSTLVVPIIPLNSDLQRTENLRGFLCVDSPKPKDFYAPVGSEILRGAADEIYGLIDKLNQLSQPKPENEDGN